MTEQGFEPGSMSNSQTTLNSQTSLKPPWLHSSPLTSTPFSSFFCMQGGAEADRGEQQVPHNNRQPNSTSASYLHFSSHRKLLGGRGLFPLPLGKGAGPPQVSLFCRCKLEGLRFGPRSPKRQWRSLPIPPSHAQFCPPHLPGKHALLPAVFLTAHPGA